MPSNNVYGTLYNADAVALSNGMLLRVSAVNRVVRALADSTANVQGLVGVNASGIVGIGGPVNVASVAFRQPVLCETGLTLAAGDTLYVSSAVAGRATNVAPTVTVAVGTVQDVATYAQDSRVLGVLAVPASATGSGGGLTDGVTLDGDGSIGNPFNALPLSAFSWRLDVLRQINLIEPGLGFNSLCFASDCNNVSAELSVDAPTNSGSAVLESTTNGGSILSSTGATNNSACVLRPRDTDLATTATTAPVRFVSNTRTQIWAAYTVSQLVSFPTPNGQQVFLCTQYDNVEDSGIIVRGVTSLTNYVLKVGATYIDTGVAFDFNPHHCLTINNGVTVKAYLDWAQIGAAGASASLGTGAGFPRIYNLNGTTGQDVQHRTARWAMAVAEPV